MDLNKSFFDYKIMTLCGFPTITLKGTKQDWEVLMEKARKIIDERSVPEFVEKWRKSLLPILQR